MKIRFIERIGTRIALRVFCHSDQGPCTHGYGCDASVRIQDIHHTREEGKYKDDKHGWLFKHWGGEPEEYPEELWPTKCDKCGTPFEGRKFQRQVFNHKLYNTVSGKPEAGDVYYIDWYPENMYWDNHKGDYLFCMLPNGREWNIDGRASNCTMKDDRLHRCWVKHGNPEDGSLHIDKNGHTCQAGAGSIWIDDWHGFLHHGDLYPC